MQHLLRLSGLKVFVVVFKAIPTFSSGSELSTPYCWPEAKGEQLAGREDGSDAVRKIMTSSLPH